MSDLTLEELAAERKRINKLYKEAREAEKVKRKPLEDAIQKALPVIPYGARGAAQYRAKCAERLAALHDAGELTFKGLDA